ncbi:hypothetical protein ACFL39_02320 [Gemmatimonadota bacterium]
MRYRTSVPIVLQRTPAITFDPPGAGTMPETTAGEYHEAGTRSGPRLELILTSAAALMARNGYGQTSNRSLRMIGRPWSRWPGICSEPRSAWSGCGMTLRLPG